ncbi:exodeoxyribonuclease V, beta subunit domain protein, partial [Vibrio parahaemolyticus AQ3810]
TSTNATRTDDVSSAWCEVNRGISRYR